MSENESSNHSTKYSNSETPSIKHTEKKNQPVRKTTTKFSTMLPIIDNTESAIPQEESYTFDISLDEDFTSATSHISVDVTNSMNSFSSAKSCLAQEALVEDENKSLSTIRVKSSTGMNQNTVKMSSTSVILSATSVITETAN